MFRRIVTVVLCLILVGGSVLPRKNAPVLAYDAPIPQENPPSDVESIETYKTTSDDDFDISLIDVESEVISRRTSDSKTFRKVDGTYVLAIYNSIIHFDQDGEFKDIDNSLNYNKSTNEYENAANRFKVSFPKEIDENKQFKLSIDNYQIKWTILGIVKSEIQYTVSEKTTENAKDLTKISQQLMYSDIQDNVNLEYVLNGNGIKENLILGNYKENYSITFTYALKDLFLLQDVKGKYAFVNAENEIIFSLDDLVMFDANGNESFDIDLIITQTKKDEYQMTIRPNDEFLRTAKYPVTIDPTIIYNSADTLIRDKYVYGNYSMDSIYSKVGFNGTYAYRTYMEFDLSQIPEDVKIHYAHLYLKTYSGKNYCTYNCTIVAREVLSTVDYNRIEEYTAQGTNITSAKEIDFANVLNSDGSTKTYKFDFSYNMQIWTDSSTPFRTIELRSQNESGFGHIWFYSDNNSPSLGPVVEIGYVSTFGLKDYWTYNSQNVGVVGTGFVSDYTGYLSFIRSDFNFETDKQSLGVNFAFSNANKNSNIGYGDGWNVNYNTTIEYDGDLGLYFTTDYTGNKVYYYSTACLSKYLTGYPFSDTCYVAEDGSQRILVKRTVNGSLHDYYIFDGKNLLRFNTLGYLVSVKDVDYDLFITINRNSTNPKLINYIKDSSENYLRFYYSSGRLSYILLRTQKIETDGYQTDYLEKVVYSYNTGTNKLSQVRYYSDYDQNKDTNIDNTVYYGYDDYNRLQTGYISNGEKVEYTYINPINDKVMVIESFYGSSKYSEIMYEYYFRETIITDHTDNFVIYKFDDYGHTTNIIDKNTNTVYYKYIDIFNNTATFVNGEYNYYLNHEMLYQSVPQKLTYNPVKNFSFEVGGSSGWTITPTLSSFLSSTALVGANSLATEDWNDDGGFAYQSVVLNEGVYTFRASILNTSGSNSGAYIQALGVSSEDVPSGSGWKNVSVPLYIRQDNTTVTLCLYNETSGLVRFDNVSVVDGIQDTRVNIVENSSFENNGTSGWSISDSGNTTYYQINDGTNEINDTFMWILDKHAVGIKGSATGIRNISTTIQRNYYDKYATGGVFYVGGWANTYSSPLVGNTNYDNDKVFRISVTFLDINGNTVITKYVNFNQSIYEWQYVYGEFEVPDDYASVKISFEYQGLGEVIFDGATVFFEASDKAYTYDELGRLVQISWDDGKKLVYLYTNDESSYPYQIKDENDNVVMVLDSDGTVIESLEKYNVKTNPGYNANGQVISMSISGYGSDYEQQNDLETTYFTTSTTYMWNNQYLATTVDEFGNTTEYQTNELTGLLEHIENAKGVKTQYEYYDNGLLYHVYIGESSTGSPYAKYVYDSQKRLIEIQLGVNYSYFIHYDDAGRMDQVQVNNLPLMSYSYMENEVNLINEYIFGNNGISEYTGEITTNSGNATITYNPESIEIHTNYAGIDPSIGGFIEVEPSTTYTVSGEILSISGSAMFNIFEYSGEPSTSTYIRVQKSSSISSPGELIKEFTTSSTTQYLIIAFYSASTYTLEFRDILLDENDGITTGIISSQTYGNGDKISFVYNDDGLVEYIRFTDSLGTEVTRFHYLYDSFGRVSIYEDLVNGTSESYEYDNQSRIAKVTFNNNDEIFYGYDTQGNLSHIEYQFGEITSNTYYNYETGFNRGFYDFTSYNNGSNTIKKDYIYDDNGLRNLIRIRYFLNANTTSYFDLEYSYSVSKTRITQMTYHFTNPGFTDIAYKYYYDSLGNITKEEYLENNVLQVKREYVYDNYNQLIKDSSRDFQYTTSSVYEDTNFTKYYYYDLNGNITDIREYGYGVSDQITYTVPSFLEQNTGTYELKMYYNSTHDYDDIYSLNIGQSPSLSFTYFDEDNFVWASGLTTTMTYSNLNVNTEGYYYRNYTATDGFFYNVQFRIVFKVGNPVSGFRDAEKHIAYQYDSNWLDQLESYSVVFDGVTTTSTFTYDNQGNPTQITSFKYMGTTYHHANLEWDGRNLATIKVYNSSLVVVAEIDYTYNDAGIRIKKVIQDVLGTTTYDYILSGSSLVHETVDNGYNASTGQRNLDYQITYSYDHDGTLIGFTYFSQGISTDYLYVLNLLGDVTHIITTAGTVVVEYVYDAYGNIVYQTPNQIIATANSFRYRSYKFDNETSWYHLNSRYYSSEMSRIINSDGLFGPVGDILGHNMYAYCANNPVMYNQGYIFGVSTIYPSISMGNPSISLNGGGAALGTPISSGWLPTVVGVIPDMILGARYLLTNGMHSKFVYATKTRYMLPIMGGTWRYIGKTGSSLANYGNLAGGTFRQILTGDAKAGLGAIAKSVGITVVISAVVNFGFNFYENNWQIDSAMLLDTAIDTAIGVSAYFMAAGTMSLIVTGVVMAGIALPGIVVVGGVILLSMGFEWMIREATGYHD